MKFGLGKCLTLLDHSELVVHPFSTRVTFNEGGNFFLDRLLLENFFDGKLWFCKDFPKL